ncbi:MAG: hypothetical protein NC517_11540 [Firmicutes bacterium]|nr:hypothetical protein [Bacillota bacterium]
MDVYHGTEKKRGEKMLANQKMTASVSDDRKQHWLGDGIYLYREIFYAFRWIKLMFRDYYGDENIREELLKRYSVLNVEIEYDPARIFNLDDPEHYMVFKRVEMQYKKKSAFSSKIEKYEYSDGVIINILFKNLKYGEHYDAVEAVFPTIEMNETLAGKSRIKFINEYQLCIKNDSMIRKIEDITDTIDFDKYSLRLSNFEDFLKIHGKKRNNASKYMNGQKGERYGKRQNP